MVNRYYRKIESVSDNIENSLQTSSLLLKINEHETTLKNYNDRFNNFQRIINGYNCKIHISNQTTTSNRNNISSNLTKITENENNILILIIKNENNISF